MSFWTARADVTVVCDPERRVSVNYTLHLYDPYWWGPRGGVEGPGESEYARLHLTGLAMYFLHEGQLQRYWRFP